MSSIRQTISIAANASIPDVLQSTFVRLQQRTAAIDGVFTIAMTQSALGLSVDIVSGARLISTDTQPVVKSIAPILPDDLSGTFAIAATEQVAIPVRNTTAGAITLGLVIDIPG